MERFVIIQGTASSSFGSLTTANVDGVQRGSTNHNFGNTSSQHAANSHNNSSTTDHSTGSHFINSGTINNFGSLFVGHHYDSASNLGRWNSGMHTLANPPDQYRRSSNPPDQVPYNFHDMNSRTTGMPDFTSPSYHTAHSTERQTNVPNPHIQSSSTIHPYEEVPQSSVETHPNTRGLKQPDIAPVVAFQYNSVTEQAEQLYAPHVQGTEEVYSCSREYSSRDRRERANDLGRDDSRRQKRRCGESKQERDGKWERSSRRSEHKRERDLHRDRDDARRRECRRDRVRRERDNSSERTTWRRRVDTQGRNSGQIWDRGRDRDGPGNRSQRDSDELQRRDSNRRRYDRRRQDDYM